MLYAMDEPWWRRYVAQVRAGFGGEFCTATANGHGVPRVRFDHGQNSGLGAIALAAHWGATRIVMLGYDCQRTGGKAHWHGDHPKGLANAGKLPEWPAQFAALARRLAHLDIVNCSRETALRCFRRADLEAELQ